MSARRTADASPPGRDDAALYHLAGQVGEALLARAWRVAVAESCTGGWVAKCLTDIAGSSRWFDRGWVTYSNAAKQQLLGVMPQVLESSGAVSRQCAEQMAAGALARSDASLAVSITGIAGPDGGTADKPVGLVWFARAAAGGSPLGVEHRFAGDREAVRRQSVATALQLLLDRARA